MSESLKQMNEQVIRQFAAEKAEPAWLTTLRLDAFAQIDQLALPKIERVKYHRWPLLEVNLTSTTSETGYTVQFDQIDDQPRLAQISDMTVFEQLPVALIEQGVIFTDLFSAMQEYPELVQEYYMSKAVKVAEDKLTAFHAAFMNSGIFLYVPKNVVIEEALEANFFQMGKDKQSFFKHVLIVAEEHSEFSYVEKYQTIDATNAQAIAGNIVVEVIAKAGAKVKYSAVDQLGENVTAYVNRRGHVLQDASIDWALGVMNEGNVVADFDSDLLGTGAHAEVKVVAISGNKQVQGIDSRVTNFAKHSIGHILQHGVIRDRGTLTFNGIGHIITGAKGADAQQESRVLMLSDNARGDANPILLIDEHEVTAGHAASVGRVDPEEMYYLMSRGLPKTEAERLVIRGFLGSVITAIPVKSVRDEFVEVIERKLNA